MFVAAMVLCGVVALLGGCATQSTTVAVDGMPHEVRLIRHPGTIPVVFENGLGSTLSEWNGVIDAIGARTTVLAYNRPGIGLSAPTDAPRDGRTVALQLHALLHALDLAPPYIVVGHSLGGLYMQYFAERYPDEVAGLVLVDATHPQQFAHIGPRSTWPWWFRMGFGLGVSQVGEAEFDAAVETGQEVLALPPYSKPAMVLTATQPGPEGSDFAREAYRLRTQVPTLLPGSTQIWVEGGHDIPRDHPLAVAAAIERLLAAQP